ncbi:TcmI family type II polyketide cyclase [Micromonospora cathayae]|uniref:TcmI family type II polyketide cyclase n=1 Tax=Micromonospora cathayae TaxID=3028804 RepID=A0ABY7ZXU6_9ACTN|nr:TcmI family type II polyketide cyclase [Micromonospora sp. HUAS 3]WDZ87273.1 TcmI family type II polyketide cyclase [Micromonospora sp. HUAS 3]
MVFRNVIVCRMVPGSEETVGNVFGHYDRTTRPQDLGVIGRYLLSHNGLYIHIIERKQDPKVSGQNRGLPAFQKIAEEIGPYVTPYPSYWQKASDSVAKEFYHWAPDGERPSETRLQVIVGRIKPGAEPDVARVFAESDAGSLPAEMGVAGRWLYSIEDVYVHLLEQDTSVAEALRPDHRKPAFAKVMQDLAQYISPFAPEKWQNHRDSLATVFYHWQARD